jgi:hypothetical protein
LQDPRVRCDRPADGLSTWHVPHRRLPEESFMLVDLVQCSGDVGLGDARHIRRYAASAASSCAGEVSPPQSLSGFVGRVGSPSAARPGRRLLVPDGPPLSRTASTRPGRTGLCLGRYVPRPGRSVFRPGRGVLCLGWSALSGTAARRPGRRLGGVRRGGVVSVGWPRHGRGRFSPWLGTRRRVVRRRSSRSRTVRLGRPARPVTAPPLLRARCRERHRVADPFAAA